jgi:uncharacterized protein with HEPN domain
VEAALSSGKSIREDQMGRHVSSEFSDEHPESPWREIVGMRHKVVHDYPGVDEDIVWQVVTEDLPPLLAPLEKILAGAAQQHGQFGPEA